MYLDLPTPAFPTLSEFNNGHLPTSALSPPSFYQVKFAAVSSKLIGTTLESKKSSWFESQCYQLTMSTIWISKEDSLKIAIFPYLSLLTSKILIYTAQCQNVLLFIFTQQPKLAPLAKVDFYNDWRGPTPHQKSKCNLTGIQMRFCSITQWKTWSNLIICLLGCTWNPFEFDHTSLLSML